MIKRIDAGKPERKNSARKSRMTEAPILEPRYDSRQSFYGKAYYTEPARDGSITLYSYETPVVRICADGEVELLPAWDYSATTLRHVKEFLKQQGYSAGSKAEIARMYTEVNESVQKKSRKDVKEGFGFGFGGACSPNALLGELEATGGFDDIMNALSDGLVGIGVVGIEADSLEDAVSKLISQVGAMACKMGVAQNTDDYDDDEF